MKKKSWAFIVLAALMLLSVPLVSQAWQGYRGGPGMMPGGPGYAGPGWQYPQFAPEQQEAYDKIMSAHQDKAGVIMNDLYAKRMELEYLAQNPKTEPKSISSLVGEVRALQNKLYELNESTASTLQKELGITGNQAYALCMGGAYGGGMGGWGRGCGGYGGGWGGHGRGWGGGWGGQYHR